MSVKDLFLHFRLHWQVMLLPLFLWGFLLAAGPNATGLISARFWLVVAVFYVLFYGGATALNSYYDQDEGPVGGLWDPPPVNRALFRFAVGAQLLGLAIIFFVSRPLFVLAAIMGLVGTAYSHPATRLKARPWASLLTVSVFQGMGGTAAGWLYARPDWSTLASTEAILGLLSSALVITGFYPLTQVYQRAQDREQGVISFAVHWGEKVFGLAIACMLAGAALMGWLAWQNFGPLPAVFAAAGPLAIGALVAVWWRRFDDDCVRENYVWMMRLGYLMTAGFLGFLGWQLARGT
jgi:1,4-dihydroxy-2-naphthoate octaprenyltransferase